ncbi:hypothetical protein CANMA_001954 [Candida margitis]|uniref:uncharacterized protein n=1 Tax=Candida margitis TaxID=1775924 RepID=UPI0022279C82|nr:uncharacterized protein CANMA_001954 [Candida margitis]KAI5968958.1 hypothetical protein CANMA_001954 [Candida margitis]
MSDNLKRAESLFNRIMNQNAESSASSSPSSTPVQAFQSSFPPRSKFHHSHHNSNSSHASHASENTVSEQPLNQNQSQNQHQPHSGQSTYHQAPSGHQVQYSELAKLPKLDAVKLTEEALSTVSANDHVLAYCWTVWHHSRNKKQQLQLYQQQQQQQQEPLSSTADSATASTSNDESTSSLQQPGVDTYLQTTNQLQFTDVNNPSTTISHIASIEQMWTMLTSIKASFNLSIGTEFLIFKIGVNPVWEDPLNAKGGRWIFRFSRKAQDHHYHSNRKDTSSTAALSEAAAQSSQLQSAEKLRKRSALIWERIVIKILTGNFIPSTHATEIQHVLHNDICGIVLSVRRDEDIISVWNSNLNFKKQQQQNASGSAEVKKTITPFQARRIICDAILRVIRECDEILSGADCIKTVDSGSNERVGGVSFEYRLHVESPLSTEGRGERKSRYGGGKYSRHNNSNNGAGGSNGNGSNGNKE